MSELKPCPSCHCPQKNGCIEIGRFVGWEVRLLCCHASCDYKVTAKGLTRRGARRRAVKKWNRRASDE